MEFEINKLLQDLKNKLVQSCEASSNAEQEAWWLLEEITKKKEAQLLQEKKLCLSEDQKETLDIWIKQRTEEKKPLQYILGRVPFLNVDTRAPKCLCSDERTIFSCSR